MTESPPPLPPRRTPPQGTSSGFYAVRPHEDEDTNPGTPAATEARRRVSYSAANDDETRALDAIIRSWLRMPLERRVLVSAICREFDPLP